MANYGLITIHDTLNYGSLLQAFSLYKAVETLEADVEILDYQCKAIADRETTYTLREIRGLIEKAGLKFVAAYDAYTKKAPMHTSERITVIAREHGK